VVTSVVRDPRIPPEEFADGLISIPTRYTLLLDADVGPMPMATAQLLFQLERAPDLAAVTGCIVNVDGSVDHCGANYQLNDELIALDVLGRGRCHDDPLGSSSPCRIIPGGMVLVKTEALRREPFDIAMGPELDLHEWSFRLDRRGGGLFFRSVEALAVRRERQSMNVESHLKSFAYFYRKHGLIVDTLFKLLPELGAGADPDSLGAGRLLLILLNQCGVEWVMERWKNNDLSPLFKTVSAREKKLQLEIDSLRLQLGEARENYSAITRTKSWKLLTLHWRLRQAWGRSGGPSGAD
jgi:hypothetical protein